MARKGWEQLSPSYRKRLERNGIDRTRYVLGADTAKARGHTSKRRENEDRQLWRLARKELGQYFDDEEIKEVIDDIGRGEALEILQNRAMAMDRNDPVARELGAAAMRTLYGQYEGKVPRAWLWYGRGK
jgi:hypothetical protein